MQYVYSCVLVCVGARAWLFFGFLFAFMGLIGSLWVFIQQFLVPGERESGREGESNSPIKLFEAHDLCFSKLSHWVLSCFPLPVAVLNDHSGASGNGTDTPSSTPLPSSNPECFPCIWQGVSFFLQNLFIFVRFVVCTTVPFCA